MIEIWKDINGYKGLYQISNLGRVKSLPRDMIMKSHASKSGSGYQHIILTKNKIKKDFNIHRLVAIAFIPNLNNYQTVNHKDEDKSNNCVDNLEWMTYSDNNNYGTRNSRISNYRKYNQFGSNNPHSKRIKDEISGRIFQSLEECACYFDVHKQTIVRWLNGTRKTNRCILKHIL